MSGNSLFVKEEEEEEDYEVRQQVDIEGDIDMIQESEHTEVRSNDLVKESKNEIDDNTDVIKKEEDQKSINIDKKEEEEEEDNDLSQEGDDEEDPVVEAYPMFMAGKDENLHILQYVNKAKLIGKRPTEHPLISSARYKKASKLWELDMPLDEEAFFSKYKAEDKWDGVEVQTLKGVGVPNEGQYIAFIKKKKIYLAPVKDVSQLRPYFKYIDASIQKIKKEESKKNQNTATAQKTQMVTMSVKSVNDPTQNRLTGSLLAHKIADEEASTDLQWIEGTVEQFQETLIKESHEHDLKPLDTRESYVSKLFS